VQIQGFQPSFFPGSSSPVLRLGSTLSVNIMSKSSRLCPTCIEALEGLKEMINLMTIPDRDRHPTLESFHEAISQQCFICTTI